MTYADRYGDLCQMSRPTKEQRLQVKSLVYRLAKYYDCTIGYDWQNNYHMWSPIIGRCPAPTHIAYMTFFRVHHDVDRVINGQTHYYGNCFFSLGPVYCYGGKDKYRVWKAFLDEYFTLCRSERCKRFVFYRCGISKFESMLLRCSSYEELDLKLSIAGFPSDV